MLKVVKSAIALAFLASFGSSAANAAIERHSVFVPFGTTQVFLPAYTGSAEVRETEIRTRLKVQAGGGIFNCSLARPCFGGATASYSAVDPLFDGLQEEVGILRTPRCWLQELCFVHHVKKDVNIKGEQKFFFETNGDSDFGKTPIELLFAWDRSGVIPTGGWAQFSVLHYDTTPIPLPAGLPLLAGSFSILAATRLFATRQRRQQA